VPTHLLTPQHLISYSVNNELVPYLQIQSNQSLDYSCGTMVTYDWLRIEQHLIDRILSGKPFIDLELRKFAFSNETRITGALANVRQRIHQSELSLDHKLTIIKELGTLQNIKKCKNIVEICIGFLSTTGGEHIKLGGEVSLTDYIKNTLLLEDVGEVLSGTISKVVQLQNIISLWNLLEEKLIVDPFEHILPKYKEELPADIKYLVEMNAPFFVDHKAELLSIWKEFILNFLNEGGGHIGVNMTVKGVIGEVENNEGIPLCEILWFSDNFPPSILMKYCVECYKLFASTIPDKV